jgi:adenylosuccinate synthase
LCITKLDVLNSMDTIKICTGYRVDGKVTSEVPAYQAKFSEVEPVYEELPGWKTDISGVRRAQDLPQQAIDYLNFIVRRVHVPIALISVGPRREQHIKVPHPSITQRQQQPQGN